jgi:mannose-1-phosphate guanylyltransferase
MMVSVARMTKNLSKRSNLPKAVILVGGPGTRLRPLTYETPKAMVPVLNRPFMEHTLAYLRQFGVEEVVLAMNYLPGAIQDYFGDGRRFGVRLAYGVEEQPMGTAGAVKNVAAYLDSTFVVLNGDIFTDLNIAGMLARHRENGARASIALHRVADPSAFGVVETDSRQRVKRFIEKPPRDKATTNWINAGTYILEPEVLEYIPGGHYMFEKGLFPRLLEAGEPVYGYPSSGYWTDMGTPGKYLSLNQDLLTLKAKGPLVPVADDGVYCEPGVAIHHSAEVAAPVVIGGHCRIGRGVRIRGPVVIGPGCRIGEGASIESAVLWDSVRVGAGASLSQCIISRHTGIEPGGQVSGCVVTPSQAMPISPPPEEG